MTPSSVPSPPVQPRGVATALNAIRNASLEPATATDLKRILETGRGRPSHVRALFGDTTLDTLLWLGIAFDIQTATILASYATARTETAAANPDLDASLR